MDIGQKSPFFERRTTVDTWNAETVFYIAVNHGVDVSARARATCSTMKLLVERHSATTLQETNGHAGDVVGLEALLPGALIFASFGRLSCGGCSQHR